MKEPAPVRAAPKRALAKGASSSAAIISPTVADRSAPPVGGSEQTKAAPVLPLPAIDPPSAESGVDDKVYLFSLAVMDALAYERSRVAAAEHLKLEPARLDVLVKKIQQKIEDNKNKAHAIAGPLTKEHEPWPHPVNLSDVLSEIYQVYKDFVVAKTEVLIAATLWVALTYVFRIFDTLPIAFVTSPDKRSAKTRFLTISAAFCNKPLIASNITPVTLFRLLAQESPTLLIDEADTFMNSNESFRGILNAGHTKKAAFVYRLEKVDFYTKVVEYNVFSPKMIASIGNQADTIMDRSIRLELLRKLETEKVRPMYEFDAAASDVVCQKLARFSSDAKDALENCRPIYLEGLNDRAKDIWQPILAIAEYAGSDWLEMAKHAALEISGKEVDVQSKESVMLAAISKAVSLKKVKRITVHELMDLIADDSEVEWSPYSKTRDLKSREMTKILRKFGVHSKTIRVGAAGSEGTAKGYSVDQFGDVFSRYVDADNAG